LELEEMEDCADPMRSLAPVGDFFLWVFILGSGSAI
jgi:hypothetical protein